MFNLSHRINAFAALGSLFAKVADNLESLNEREAEFLPRFNRAIVQARNNNGWFEPQHIRQSFGAWADELTEDKLAAWMNHYPEFKEPQTPKNVAVIMAGNIPLVGFHDFLTVLLTGNNVQAKMAKDDAQLLPVISEYLIAVAPEFSSRINLVLRVENPDVVIATGSDNSARYFEAYFGKYPHIIRKNRTSVAVIDGTETHEDLQKLGEDFFTYFGLGCRNVSKIYVPINYDLNNIFAAIVDFDDVANNNKYANNYDYYRAIYMLNNIRFLENGFVLFKEDTSLHTPISVIHYEYYTDKNALLATLEGQKENIQCVVGHAENQVDFGAAQHPGLLDYADGVDTVAFLMSVQH